MALYRGLQGGQNRWDDLRFSANLLKLGATSKPDFDYTNVGLLFPQNDATEKIYLNAQIPHNWLLGSSLYPHLHYVQDESEEPTFKLDYRWYETGGDPTVGFTTITADTWQVSYSSGSILQVLSFPAISGTGKDTLSSMLDLILYRDDNTVSGDILVKEFDIHYQKSGWGSRQEFTP